MIEKLYADRLYKYQGNQIRKKIRNYEKQAIQNAYLYGHKGSNLQKDINIAVLGPKNSGKTSLIKTINYALNQQKQAKKSEFFNSNSFVQITKNTIKNSQRVEVNGVQRLKQITNGINISLNQYKIQQNPHSSKPRLSIMQKYVKLTTAIFEKRQQMSKQQSLPKRLYKAINSPTCDKNTNKKNMVNFVIVCINMVQKLANQEAFAIKCFLSDLEDKNMKYLIIGTNVDRILAQTQVQQQKILYIDGWKQYINRQILPKNMDKACQIFCIQNYMMQAQYIIDDQINYYALHLMHKILRQLSHNNQDIAEQVPKKQNKASRILCFCS